MDNQKPTIWWVEAAKHYLTIAMPFVIVGIMISVLVRIVESDPPGDDTDPPDGISGLSLGIDHRTGCHYVGHTFGGVTPRLDAQGRHICERPDGP